jgi:hypothetical protein
VKFKKPTEIAVASAMMDLVRAAQTEKVPWALIGGQALRVHGVPRNTLDAYALVSSDGLVALAEDLVVTYKWRPLVYDKKKKDYVKAEEIKIHYMDDPVLFDMGENRMMIPLLSPLELIVELLSAQHPVEEDMIASSIRAECYGVPIKLAPLGGVLLVKAKADRTKDTAAIEQTAEHLPASTIRAAIAWAAKRDPETAKDLQSKVDEIAMRKSPFRIGRASSRKT